MPRTEGHFYKLFYEQRGFIIFPGVISAALIGNCIQLIEHSSSDDWTPGDQSAHAWRELARQQIIPLADIIDPALVGRVLGKPVRTTFQWMNRYHGPEHIGDHRDAGGDAHLLAGIRVPPGDCGGQLWLDTASNILPIGTGDLVLFDAKNHRHGTTPITAPNEERITLNTRLWV